MVTKRGLPSSNWLPKIPFPHLGGDDAKDREALEAEIRQLRSALRWSMGFIINVSLGMEITDGAKVELAQIKQGIKEGLKRSQVPRGVLTNLHDAVSILKEWDFKTFRLEQNVQVVEMSDEKVVLRHGVCPAVLKTMRRAAPFLIDKVSADHYLYLPSPLDFLCVPHSLCRSVLIDWLSDGKFEVEELCCERSGASEGGCSFAIKRAMRPTRRHLESARSSPGT